MTLSAEELKAWRYHFQARKARDEAEHGPECWNWLDHYQPPPPRKPSGLLTPPGRDRGAARPTRVDSSVVQQTAPVSPPASPVALTQNLNTQTELGWDDFLEEQTYTPEDRSWLFPPRDPMFYKEALRSGVHVVCGQSVTRNMRLHDPLHRAMSIFMELGPDGRTPRVVKGEEVAGCNDSTISNTINGPPRPTTQRQPPSSRSARIAKRKKPAKKRKRRSTKS